MNSPLQAFKVLAHAAGRRARINVPGNQKAGQQAP